MTVRAKADICGFIQWLAILIAVVTGIYVILTGETQLGVGMIAAALSSAHVVTNKLPRCVNGIERRLTPSSACSDESCEGCPTSMQQASTKE